MKLSVHETKKKRKRDQQLQSFKPEVAQQHTECKNTHFLHNEFAEIEGLSNCMPLSNIFEKQTEFSFDNIDLINSRFLYNDLEYADDHSLNWIDKISNLNDNLLSTGKNFDHFDSSNVDDFLAVNCNKSSDLVDGTDNSCVFSVSGQTKLNQITNNKTNCDHASLSSLVNKIVGAEWTKAGDSIVYEPWQATRTDALKSNDTSIRKQTQLSISSNKIDYDFHQIHNAGKCFSCYSLDYMDLFCLDGFKKKNSHWPRVRQHELQNEDGKSMIKPFLLAFRKYNERRGPNLKEAIEADNCWVYEYIMETEAYMPNLSRYPRYMVNDSDKIEYWNRQYDEWIKRKGHLRVDISTGQKIEMVNKANTSTRQEKRKKKNSKIFTIVKSEPTKVGNIDVDCEEKECHCPFCPMDINNPGAHFYDRKKSAYRGHLINTHGILPDNKQIELPQRAEVVYIEDKDGRWIHTPIAKCPYFDNGNQCPVWVKLTDHNHGLLGYLRHYSACHVRK
ncbi:hypothetical protein DAMA08_047140 [Martiniozyma asiatica (nom. inval.)]|nr:hypothetical protein DAMA08_047140 [Martiniozyma asiatica]